MADLPLSQIREKKFRQQEINLDQFTDEELCSKNRFGRESIQYLVEILKNDLERTRRKHRQLPRWLLCHVINLVIIKHGHYEYSYSYNIKLVGVPEVKQRKSAGDTLELCMRIFNKIGAEIHPYDLDIAHRVPSCNTFDGRPKPIICNYSLCI